jgi:Flp pilus assembly protein TadG
MLEQKSLSRPRIAGGRHGGLSRLWQDRTGVTAVEFAIIAPIMVLMFICMADLGIGVYTDMQVNNAAQYGTEYALAKGYDSSAITTAVKSATSLSSPNVTPTEFCGCPASSGVTNISCNASCSDGGKVGTYVQVAVSSTYTTMLSYPGLPSSYNLSAQSTVRLQ